MQDTMYKLGQVLVKQNVVSFDVLEKALKIKRREEGTARRNLAQILVEDFEVERDSVFRELANQYGFRNLKFSHTLFKNDNADIIKKIMQSLPKTLRNIMQNEKILILKDPQSAFKYVFAAVDPTSRHIPLIARAIRLKKYEVCYVQEQDYQAILDKILPPENEFLKAFENTEMEIHEDPDEDSNVEEDALDAEVNKSMLVNLAEGMLVDAVRRGASDIHMVPKDVKTTNIFFRIDGKLQPWNFQKKVRPEAMAAIVKDRSKNIDRFERETGQDGYIQRQIDGHLIRYRVSILPIVGKEFQYKLESVVIRILDDRNVITDPNQLGFHGKAKEAFVKSISKPQGMVIVTGPTGSGKSTTLIAALNYVIKPEINVLTVEDPVEYIIPGVRQIKIGPKNNFEQALRAILRHDPDVVMVGEIRDKDTAEIAIKLANTGHLTFSTLHTNDAPSAISRLYKMGMETFLIAYAINLIIAQRLIRKLCDKCKRPMKDLDPNIPASLGFTKKEIDNTTFYEAVGCDNCHGGYKGRIAIHESLLFSPEIRKLIFETGMDIDEESIRKQAIKEGMLTLRAAGRERVKQGISTLEELAQATSED